MLSSLQSLALIVTHLWTAIIAVVRWWATMSDVEKRQAHQRALSVAACAAAFVVGGPLIGHRFEAQKTDEAYRADAAELATQLVSNRSDWRSVDVAALSNEGGQLTLRNASYTAARPGSLVSERLGELDFGASLRRGSSLTLDDQVQANFASLTSSRLELAEREKTDLECLSEAVYYEARSESVRGQMAVAEVIMNRAADGRFPNSICGVVYQGQYRDTGCQFTFTCDGSLGRKPRGRAWDRAKAVAVHVQMGLSTPITNQATHYHTDYVDPYWSAGLIVTAQLGSHIFYRFPKGRAESSQVRLALDAQEQQRIAHEALEAEALVETGPLDVFGEDLRGIIFVPAAADGADEIVVAGKQL